MARRLSFSILMACRRFGILLFLTASLLQFFSVSTAEYHHNAAEVPGVTRVDYYLRGQVEGRRQLEETSSFEADSVEVADYSPCANDKHDRSLCKSP